MFRIATSRLFSLLRTRFVPYSGAEAYRNLKNEKIIWLNDKADLLETKRVSIISLAEEDYLYSPKRGCLILSGSKDHQASASEEKVEALSSYKTGLVPIEGL